MSEPASPQPSELSPLWRWLSVFSLLSTYTAGILGHLVVSELGGPLAMGAQMYLALNTEPNLPAAPWPIAASIAAGLLPLPFLFLKRWRLAGLAAVPFVLIPWYQLFRLYQAAGQG